MKIRFNNTVKQALVTLSASALILSGAALAEEKSPEMNPSQTKVSVQEPSAQVKLEQPAPKVSVQPHEAEVDVSTGEPEVTIDQPEPQVDIDQPAPDVSIRQAEPEVVVNGAEPVVEVRQEEPEVNIEKAEPKINVVRQDSEGKNKSSHVTSATLLEAEIESLEGKSVVTSAGKELGNVEEIVERKEGGEPGFVVAVGGFFGVGESEIFVPADEAHLEDDRIVWQTSMSDEQIESTEKYQSDNFRPVSDEHKTLSDALENS